MNYCDDGGACHHNCADRSGKCYRRQCCEPLSNVFPNDEWPPPSGAEVHGTDPTLKPTPTPSITVGTQVRLTGVVQQVQPNGAIGVDIYVGCQDGLHWFRPAEIEVIRQPFKRGEVVYLVRPENVFEEYPRLVKDDELKGNVTIIDAEGNIYTRSSQDFERRP